MIVVVGAHSRNVGKTSIVCSILRAVPEAAWTAVKISARRTGPDGGFQAIEETAASPRNDTARYLLAGAAQAWRLRARDDEMPLAAAAVEAWARQGRNLLLESNRIVEFVEPDLYALALDFRVEDFKESARRTFRRAGRFVLFGEPGPLAAWPAGLMRTLAERPAERLTAPDEAPLGLVEAIRAGLRAAPARRGAA